MALVPCSECGRPVSDQATACPVCGFPPAAACTPLSAFAGGMGCVVVMFLGFVLIAGLVVLATLVV